MHTTTTAHVLGTLPRELKLEVLTYGPAAAVLASSYSVTACRLVYRHCYLLGDDANVAAREVRRAWFRGDVETISNWLSWICAALYELEGAYDRWVEARNALTALGTLA